MKKKYALITGGSRGIGSEIAKMLAKDLQYNILINFNSNLEAAHSVQKEIETLNVSCELLQFDVSNATQTSEKLSRWKSDNENCLIEVIVNNAGITKDGLFMWTKPEDWHSVIDTSLHGFYNVTQPLIKELLKNRYGRIINIVSVSGLKGNAGQVNYSAAKGGLVAATKALAQEIGKRNITVNAVAPGFIRSNMTADFNEDELKKFIPLNRFGEAEEVANLVSFLASRKSGYITGEVININGGLYS